MLEQPQLIVLALLDYVKDAHLRADQFFAARDGCCIDVDAVLDHCCGHLIALVNIASPGGLNV